MDSENRNEKEGYRIYCLESNKRKRIKNIEKTKSKVIFCQTADESSVKWQNSKNWHTYTILITYSINITYRIRHRILTDGDYRYLMLPMVSSLR